jgi:hypothetical protein
VTEQKLDGAQVARSLVDQGRLGSSQRVCAELQRVEADARDPLRYEAGVLAGGEFIFGPRRPDMLAKYDHGRDHHPSLRVRYANSQRKVAGMAWTEVGRGSR